MRSVWAGQAAAICTLPSAASAAKPESGRAIQRPATPTLLTELATEPAIFDGFLYFVSGGEGRTGGLSRVSTMTGDIELLSSHKVNALAVLTDTIYSARDQHIEALHLPTMNIDAWLTPETGFQDIVAMDQQRLVVLDGNRSRSRLIIFDVRTGNTMELRRHEDGIQQVVADPMRVTWQENDRLLQYERSH